MALQGNMKRLNAYEDHIKILDFELRSIVSIYLGEDGSSGATLTTKTAART